MTSNSPVRFPGFNFMIDPRPVTLEAYGVRLEPLERSHSAALLAAAADGELWKLWYVATADLAPGQEFVYVDAALKGQQAGHMLPWVVRELSTGTIVGSTRFHDIVREIDRVEIGYTFYAQRWQRTHVNTACKLLLLGHAFDTLGCKVVGLRVDNLNEKSQKAVEALGAKKDGVVRHFQVRRDGSARDTHMYSILAAGWRDVKRRLEARLQRSSG
jgi:RimJ/RimL family protein N-acetyltransferase